MDFTLIVLAAGLSTRYGALKQLEPVGPSGEALLDYGVYDAWRAGFSRVVLVMRRELEEQVRAHLGARFADAIELAYAYQALDDLPAGFAAPKGREKPWGSGHAILVAEPAVAGPFVAMNADDFYGAEAFQLLRDHLQATAGSPNPDIAVAGYTLRDTLSPFGGVSRAICECDEDGYLERITEVKDIRERDGVLAGATESGDLFLLDGDETISTNLWAATPGIFPLLGRGFAEFLAERGDDVEAEFLLSTSINEQIAAGQVRVRVLPTRGLFLGITHPQDKADVVAKLERLAADGDYPADLGVAVS